MYDIRFRINSPDVVEDTIDGEAVIVNLRTGHYYSLENIGAEIWGLIVNGSALDEIVEWIGSRYEGDREQIARAVSDLVGELCKEELLINANGSSVFHSPNVPHLGPVTHKKRFELPSLQKYTDMQDILLLDPIHDVDESGWPNIKINTEDDASLETDR